MKSQHLQETESFHNIFNAPVLELGETPSIDRRKLRLKLIFEELSELAESFGLSQGFAEICALQADKYYDSNNGYPKINTEEFNQVEALDACADLQVVLDGTILECGFGEIMDKASTEVFESNMSKACSTEEEVINTRNKYALQDIDTLAITKGNKYIVQRTEDLKILKSINYKPANLAQFIK